MTEAQITIQLLETLLEKMEELEEQGKQLKAVQAQLANLEHGVLNLSAWSQSQELRLSEQHEVQERHLKGLLGQLSEATTRHQERLSQAEQAAQHIKEQVKTQEATSARLSSAAKMLSLKMWASMVFVGVLVGVSSVGALGLWMWPQLKQEMLRNTGSALAVFQAEQREEAKAKSQVEQPEASAKKPSPSRKKK